MNYKIGDKIRIINYHYPTSPNIYHLGKVDHIEYITSNFVHLKKYRCNVHIGYIEPVNENDVDEELELYRQIIEEYKRNKIIYNSDIDFFLENFKINNKYQIYLGTNKEFSIGEADIVNNIKCNICWDLTNNIKNFRKEHEIYFVLDINLKWIKVYANIGGINNLLKKWNFS